ncbi:crotonase/enoyl-CoA hydratase family protein [Thalassovita taeanensis]|uniref:Short chain enoyl-CoA hydratase /Enoyl-CoA hydratase n=1 Tax=Thalassovita taeanensis TaxID=657014 RepID=A0A1H9IG57_9RHOB|nr:crotonase/enoyl-CoA hydratase family protein [Thalassovita taeanensis]SEQ73583.1 short chain enoyl-CoA hydratase /Enoyl-CoA hydratase [Thalassovita taeanensis]
MKPFLDVQQDGAILTLTMMRPEERNAISDVDACNQVVEVCADVARNRDISVVILTGEGTSFSSGGNLKKMLDRSGFAPKETPIETRYSYIESIQRITLALYDLEVPTIAAVNGPAIGAGLDLATMCDIRIASDKAIFAESFVKVGIIPGDGGAWLLPRAVGASKAAELCFTGEMIDAAEAERIGLVSRVVPHDDLMSAARALAEKIAANPVHALRLSKRLLREGENMNLSQVLQLSAAFQSLMHETDDHREAVTSFLEKRKPVFTRK